MKLEDEVREALARQAEDVATGAPALDQIKIRGARRKRVRRVTAGLTGLGLLVALAVPLALLGPLASNPTAHPLGPGQVIRVPVRDPQPIVADNQAVWVAGDTADHRKVLYRIDAQTHQVVELDNTAGANWPAVGEGFAWTTCGSRSCHGPSVLKLDPETGATLATIPLPGHSWQITTGLGYVWVTTESGIVKIAPDSAKIVKTFRGSGNLIAISGGAVWVTDWKQGDPRKVAFAKLDPATGKLLAQVDFPYPCTVLGTAQMLWSATCQPAAAGPSFHDELVGIDPATSSVLYRVPSTGVAEMVFADGHLWTSGLSGNTATVTERNPVDGQPTGATVRGPSLPGHGVESMSFAPPAIFVASGGGAFWLTHVDGDAVIGVGIPNASDAQASGVRGSLTYYGGPSPGRFPHEPGTVRVERSDGTTVALRHVTQGSGFSIPLDPGNYRLVATSGDAACQPRDLTVQADTYTTVEVQCSVV